MEEGRGRGLLRDGVKSASKGSEMGFGKLSNWSKLFGCWIFGRNRW